jgi:sulfatase modifying factor 1
MRHQGRPHGDFDERPQQFSVGVDAFHVSVTEVTNAEYERFDPSHAMLRGFEHGYSVGDHEAVVFVSHANATAYCEWLTAQHAADYIARSSSSSTNPSKPASPPLTYRLPTEVEWERAARAGTSTNFWWGDVFDTHHAHAPGAVCPDKCPNLTVATFAPNPFGLYDTVGNVEEWTSSLCVTFTTPLSVHTSAAGN